MNRLHKYTQKQMIKGLGKVARTALGRTRYVVVAAGFTVAVISSISPATAGAYGMLSNRSIMMSSTANGATNTAYQVNFTTVTNNQNVGSVVVLFCSNSPIMGDSCAVPAGFDTNHDAATPTVLSNVTGNITGLTIDATNSTDNRFVLTRTPGAVANGAVSFTLGDGITNGITNPTNTNTTFFARILTFASIDGTGSETADSLDAGGIALSTANQLNVTAKVQEALYFCVYTQATCQDGGTAIALGDENGVLASNTTTYTANASIDISSNAFAGVSVKIKGDTLRSGTNTISEHGAACTPDSVSSSVEQFGIRFSTLGTGHAAVAPYDCNTGEHGFDTSQTTALYGQDFIGTSGATDIATSVMELAAKSANTSEAGIYTSTLTFIATATY